MLKKCSRTASEMLEKFSITLAEAVFFFFEFEPLDGSVKYWHWLGTNITKTSGFFLQSDIAKEYDAKRSQRLFPSHFCPFPPCFLCQPCPQAKWARWEFINI
jgi:hypothetical protein